MTTQTRLPAGFATLEPFVDQWAVPGGDARMRRRIASTAAARESFYQAARPLLEPALKYLDERPLDGLLPEEARLLDLLLALAQVSLAVENQRDAEPHHSKLKAQFQLECTSEDFTRSGAGPSATR